MQPREPLASEDSPQPPSSSGAPPAGLRPGEDKRGWVPEVIGGLLGLLFAVLTGWVNSLHSDLQETRGQVRTLTEQLQAVTAQETADRKDLEAERQRLDDFRRQANAWASGAFADTCKLAKGKYDGGTTTCDLLSGGLSVRFQPPFP
jgi:hypothetical protein